MENVTQQEELIRKHLEQGNKEAAVKALFELAVAYAKEKNFKAAESMRDRIFEIEPMALTEIIRSGEIIEEEKSETIDKGHREIWTGLYDSLTVDEANALYFALNKATFQPDETIFRQGEWKPRLYFVNNGRAKIVYVQNGREVFLKSVEPGKLAGEDTFFSFSVCTTTMVAMSKTEVSFLEADVLKEWKTTFPILESKLHGFASKAAKIPDILKSRELDRRVLKRVHVRGKAVAQIMTTSEKPVGKPFKVDMYDISQGGVCFLVKVSKRETARLLLGQRVEINYLHPQMDTARTVNKNGIIVGVRFSPFEDSAVNVKFDEPLPREFVEEYERVSNPTQDFDF